MSSKQHRDFWEVAFSPDRDFIVVFLIMLLVTTLTGNLMYSLMTDADSLTTNERLVTLGVILGMLLIAGFLWEKRRTRYIPFHVNEKDRLQRSQAVVAIPSNSGMIGKIIRFHGGILEHIWLVGDETLNDNCKKCEQDYHDYGVKFHRIMVGGDGNAATLFDGYKRAAQEATELGIEENQIIIDITGGKKPMSISAFLLALERGLRVSYVESNYEQISGRDVIERVDEAFQVVQFDMSIVPSKSIYEKNNDSNAQ